MKPTVAVSALLPWLFSMPLVDFALAEINKWSSEEDLKIFVGGTIFRSRVIIILNTAAAAALYR